MKQQSNTQKQGALTAIQTGCLGALHGSQSLTALNRWGMFVFNEEYYLECLKSYDIYKKNEFFTAFSPFVVYPNA